MATIPELFQIASDERVTIVGASGTGKSFGAMELLQYQTIPFIVFDSKHSKTVLDGVSRVITRIEDLDRVGKYPNPPAEKVAFRPPWDASAQEIIELADGICRWCYLRGNIGFYGDEFTEISPGLNPPRNVRGVAVRGRERDVPLWAASQRPVGIPKVLISEANHYFVYQLRDRADRDRIAEACEHPIQKDIQQLSKYEFIYVNAAKGTVSGPFIFRKR